MDAVASAWKDKDHPELKQGAAKWVKKVREETEGRFQKVTAREMATLLLDTSVIINAINEKKDRRQFLRGLVEQNNILACCPINVTEIYAGMRPKEEPQTTRFLTSLPVSLPAWLA